MVKKLGFSDQLSCDLFSGLQLFSAPEVREFGTEMLAQNASLTFRWFVVKLFALLVISKIDALLPRF